MTPDVIATVLTGAAVLVGVWRLASGVWSKTYGGI